MAEIIRLGKIRKDRARQDARKRADENAVAFGRTKTQKQADKARAEKARRHLDAHKRGEEDE